MFFKLPINHQISITRNITFNNKPYHIKATLNHHGPSRFSGHWTTTMYTSNNKYITFDDAEIYFISTNKEAALVIYETSLTNLPSHIPINIPIQQHPHKISHPSSHTKHPKNTSLKRHLSKKLDNLCILKI